MITVTKVLPEQNPNYTKSYFLRGKRHFPYKYLVENKWKNGRGWPIKRKKTIKKYRHGSSWQYFYYTKSHSLLNVELPNMIHNIVSIMRSSIPVNNGHTLRLRSFHKVSND